MLNNLINKFSENKKSIFIILFFVLSFFIFSDSVFAQQTLNAEYAPPRDSLIDTDKIIEIIGEIGKVIGVFLVLFTYLTTVFISPEWITGSIFGLNAAFKTIWIMVSNIVYFIFAFILIWIAFMNIIGKGQDKYALKQALPKFVIGVLIVPFSWFLVNFILSISAFLTVTALNIPYDTFKGFSEEIGKVKIPLNCTINTTNSYQNNADNVVQGYYNCANSGDGDLITFKELMSKDSSVDSYFGILSLYIYGILGIEGMHQLNNLDFGSIKTIGDLVIKVLFDIIFILIYAILIIALGLVLVTRSIYIWIYIMISPLFGLMYFFDKSSGGGEGFFAKFNLKNFISLAMVPVFAMLALSFGLLFLFIIGTGMTYDGANKSEIFSVDVGNNNESTLSIGRFSIKFLGPISNDKSLTGLFTEIGNDLLGVIGTFILKIFGIIILWGAVMAALRTNEITKAVVEPLYSFGNQVGQLAAKAPQYAPIFGGQSMTSMSQIGATATSHFENKARERGTTFLQEKGLFGQNAQTESKAANALTELKNSGLNKNSVTSFSKALHEFKTSQQAANSKSMVEAAKILAKDLGINEEHYNNIDGNRDNFSMLMSMIDQKLDNNGNSYGNLFTDRTNIGNHGEFNGAVLDTYLSENSGNPNSSGTQSAGSQNVNVSINTDNVLTGFGGSLALKLKLESDNKFNLEDSNRTGYLAKHIGNIGKDKLEEYFHEDLITELRKYYDKDGKFVQAGGQPNGKFPWEQGETQ